MQIGMSLTTSYGIERDPKTLMDGLTQQVKAMAAFGFASLSLGDHHVTRNNYFQVLPTMSHLSAYTGEMRLIPLFLLPFYNPILLAEQLAMLDVISGGRTTVISGLGHQPEAHDAFETPQRLRVSRFTETFEIMRLLWKDNDASYSGRHYSFSGVSINPKPLSRPLPMWIGANAEPAVRRAARIADAWVISPGWTPDYIRGRLRLYRAALEDFGRSDEVSELVVRRDLHLAQTREEAMLEAEVLYERSYRGFGEREMEDSLIVGDAETCINALERLQDIGATHILFRCALDEHKQAMQTIRVLGEQVIPQFRG
ncbi:MAG: LLM class flavin-dependent oxidoreductase [Chloroflexi bacterium]|nr:LLM class flavin-dependent oxidoreductase [Chloroflexota bacterium]